MRLNQSFQVVAVLRRAEILFEGKIYRTSKVMMNFQKRKEHGLYDKLVNSLSSLALQQTQLSSKLQVKCQYPSHFDWYIFSSSFFLNSGSFSTMIEKISHYSSFSHPNHPNVSLWNFSYRKGRVNANDDAILHCNCIVHVLRVRSFRSTTQGGWACHFRYDAARTHLQDNEIIDCIWMPSACYNDFRCHSFNYVISEELFELNNRTKEARP